MEEDEVHTVILHRMDKNGVVASLKFEKNLKINKITSVTPVIDKDIKIILNSKLSLNYPKCDPLIASVKITKVENYSPKINIPVMVRCQNCETIFPTKYQYQRHQCEFNAEKVVLKTEVVNNAEKQKDQKSIYECTICRRQFVSESNLERHLPIHTNTKETTCEHCNKQFVSENRLRIHKENHCKRAGDITKFYRSDVSVWKCLKCSEVFSSVTTANFHFDNCTDSLDNDKQNESSIDVDKKKIEKISTEILLQCEFCNRTYANSKILLNHQKTHTTAKNYECVLCKSIFDGYVQATQHWITKCTDNVNLFCLPKLTYCEFCDRTFKSHEMLYNHKIKKRHYTQKLYKSLAISNDTEDKIVESEKINYPESKNEIDKIYEDVLIALDVPINKINKKTKFINENNTENNKENINPLDLENTMIIKSESFSDNENNVIIEKKKRGRKKKLTKQSMCKPRKLCLTTADGYKYQCEHCIKVWNSIAALEHHREKEHKNNFSCNECGQVLPSNKALFIHQRAHKNLKPYVCDTCGRSYSQTSHLWQHMRFHQGIKPFACPHEGCEARYTIRPDLKDHIRKVHTRERPFKCNVCGKCFLTGSVYYQHRLIHTDDRRYGCEVCGKRFFRADALNNHKRIHTNERPYPCVVCGREFRQKGDRNKHFRTQHVMEC